MQFVGAFVLGFLSLGLPSVEAQSDSCQPGERWDDSLGCIPCPMTYNGKCVSGCPSGTYTQGTTCYDTCPTGTFTYFSECVTNCPSDTFEYMGNCVGGCPGFTYGNKCVDSCPSQTVRYENTCFNECPSGTKLYNGFCYNTCPSGIYAYQGTCVSQCPSSAPNQINGECKERNDCPYFGMYYESIGSTKCVSKCPKTYLWANSTCVDQCLPGQKISAVGCRDTCVDPSPFVLNGTHCVMDCPKYYDLTTFNCVDICPQGTVVGAQNRCTKCPPMAPYIQDGTCVQRCPAKIDMRTNTCVDACPVETYQSGDNMCFPTPSTSSCSSNQYQGADGSCYNTTSTYEPTPSCSSNQYLGTDGTCYNATTTTCNFYLDGRCIDKCPADYLEQWGQCVKGCSERMFRNGTQCVSYCLSGHAFNGTCVERCPREAPLTLHGECMSQCPTNFKPSPFGDCYCMGVWNMGKCESSCPPTMFLVDRSYCSDTCPTGYKQEGQNCTWINPCGANQFLNGNGTCETYYGSPSCGADQWVFNNTCIPACKANEYMDPNGKCVSYPTSMCPAGQWSFNNTCVPACAEREYLDMYGKCVRYTQCDVGFWNFNNTCVPACKEGEFFDKNGHCTNPQAMCAESMQGAVYNTTTHICGCPAGYWITKDLTALTTATMPVKCAPAPSDAPKPLPRIHCKSFIAYTVWVPELDNCMCDREHPIVVPNPEESFLPYRCASTDTPTTLKQCVTGEYFDFMEGLCVKMNVALPTAMPTVVPTAMPTIVRSPMPSIAQTPMPTQRPIECTPDQALVDGVCMTFAEMCQKRLPGSLWLKNTCACPNGQWMTRNPFGLEPLVVCAPASFDVPIHCRSFIANTVYEPLYDNCRCSNEYPVVVEVTAEEKKRAGFGYACAAAGTATSVKQCERGSYFDFMQGTCVVVEGWDGRWSPSPSARPIDRLSSTSTQTAMPSKRPSMTPSATRTSKPSNRPGSPTSTRSASRTPRPSAAIFADVSRKPLPSVRPLPPPPVEKSPAPSAWPKKTDAVLILAPEEKPAYIDAKVAVQGANATEMTKPEKIQQMQASLACTLRMPLENIMITNITYIDQNGKTHTLNVDPTKFMMAGDGSTDCYQISKPLQRRLRNLQGATGGRVEIDYAIVAPSDDILAMDTKQMQDVIATSPTIVETVAAVGGSSITASAPEAIAASAAAPSASATPLSAGSSNGVTESAIDTRGATYGGIAAIGVAGLVITLAIFYVKEKKRSARLLKEKMEADAKAAAAKATARATPVVVMFEGENQMRVNPIGGFTTRTAASARFDAVPETTRRSVQPLKSTHTSDWTARHGTAV